VISGSEQNRSAHNPNFMERHSYLKPVAYVSFRTFMSALDNLKASSLSARLDRANCGNFSDSTWRQLTRSLRLLELVDELDVPTESLKSLVRVNDRKPILRRLLKKHYPELFAADLSRVGLARFDKLLAVYAVSGATLRKARSFFLGAAKYSEVPLSPEVARIIRRRVTRPLRSVHSETRYKKGVRNTLEQRASENDTVSLTLMDISLSLSFPGGFAKLAKDEREHLYHLLDELVLLNQRAAASRRQDDSESADVDTTSSDSSDEVVH
jgi:hypothetical protein